MKRIKVRVAIKEVLWACRQLKKSDCPEDWSRLQLAHQFLNKYLASRNENITILVRGK